MRPHSPSRPTYAALAGLALILTVESSCASKQKSPDSSEAESPNYRSTRDSGAAAGGTSSDRESAQKSEATESTGRSQSGAAEMKTSAAPKSGKGGGQQASVPEATGPVAHVDGEPIPAEVFNEEIEKVAKSGRVPARLLRKFESRLVDRLVDKKLTERAIENSSTQVSDEAVDERFQQFQKRYGKEGSGKKRLEKMRDQFGITDADLKDSIRQSIAIKKLLVDRGMELPTEEEVRAYYDENASEFERPAQVRARHILFRVSKDSGEQAWDEKKKKATSVRDRVMQKDVSFAEVAESESDGPSSKRGGDLGYISREKAAQMGGDFADTAFSLESGDVSEPVKSKYGWHVVKAVDRREAESVPFEKAKGQLRRKLENRKVKSRLKKFTRELRSKAEIEKHPENIE